MTSLRLIYRVLVAHAVLIFISSLAFGAEFAAPDKSGWWRPGTSQEGGDHSIKRSPSDDRSYRYLVLKNGLKVLLISDPETDKSAASLNVNVGSFQNPQGRDGLAHFLEHMLFLGTDKYPEAGAYQKFISEHGGQHNAYTAMEDTNYFFDVDAKYLLAALKRFSRFFIAPRFDKAYVERERNAVESEFRLKLKDDSRREWEVFSEQVKPAHPLSKFSVGDLETLADRGEQKVRTDLVAFYEQYYSADVMTLVVLGRERLGQLEVAIRGMFTDIPRSADFAQTQHFSDRRETDQLTFKRPLPFELDIQPLKDQRSISIAFPMPSMAAYWRTKPGLYWGHVLGDESQGSLIAQLKKLGLANALSAGPGFDTHYGANFIIQLALTPDGVAKQDFVIDQVFAWINLARSQGLAQWRYEELAKLQHTSFQFSEKSSASAYVQHLSAGMRYYPATEAVRGGYLMDVYDHDVLTDFVNYLRPENALITLLAPEVEQTDRVSPRYAAPYRINSIKESALERWNKIKTKELAFARANPYIARAYPLSDKGGAIEPPVKLDAIPGLNIWHYADQQFGSPLGLFEARIATPALGACRNVALADLYVALVQDALADQTYQAGLAGLGYSLYRWNSGLGLRVNGYTDRQTVLLDQVLKTLLSPDWQNEDFERLRTTLIRGLRNSKKQWPIRQLFAQVGPMMKGDCGEETLANELELLTLNDVILFLESLYNNANAEFYAGGALSITQSLAMATSTMASLNLVESADRGLYERVVRLPEKVLIHSIEVDHNDSSAMLYIQGDEDTLSERADMALISTILEAPFYTSMRTEKQLGYVVGARIMHMNRVPGLAFYIQSPHSSAAQLEAEINGFLAAFVETIAAISDKELLRFKTALLANIEQKPQNIMQQAARHQEALQLGFDDFQFRPKLVEQIKEIGRERLVSAYQRLVIEGSRRLLVTTRNLEESGPELKYDALKGIEAVAGQGVFTYSQ